ncbi:putative serine peptidase S28 family protein precursor [Zea mays]|uniref:Alpha/beta-Hydrolases superfamily protein n=1 Tax=Zea mays TaxID=4577 RepID=B4F9I1_MAIZE|nr:putative serine peptidase S28 family protein precursor [Zea mays]ACF78774.1 unknown [Zea mays]ACF88076.1 unknown [Zea mays]AQK81780.1 alpha/beta-Hydrolases superfamily protein [Zea mays]|eukprot:NP_001142279.1 putative serine peptidase S28 family protein precursor [Zea mays]
MAAPDARPSSAGPPPARSLLLPLLLVLLLAAYSLPADSAARPSSNSNPRPAFTPPLLKRHQLRRPSSSSAELVAGPANASTKPFTAHYFPQLLDHFAFTPNASTVFRHKYLLNDTFWRRPGAGAGDDGPGPLFVYTGNEGDIEWFATNTGFMFDIAPTFGALLVFIEHRFYGESKPFGNDSYRSAETLGYLTSTQALADFAVVIRGLKRDLGAEAAPVVVFGGSYGGMLASWFRLKYPHVAIGALASSAPILQFDHITPWSSFYDAVSQDFKSESSNCFGVIRAAWDVLDERGATDKGLLDLSKLFRACKTVKYAYSIRNWLWTAFTYTAMVDYPTPANFLENLPAYPVKEMCKTIDAFPAGADVLEKAFAAASLYYNYTGDQACNKIEDGDDPHGLDGWQWQACTEMIMPMTISNESMFPPSAFSYDDRSDECFQSWGVRPRPHWITTEYGGYKIDKVLKRFGSNIIFSNGMRDPWSRGGVLKNISSSIIALVTEKGAHHLDLRSSTKGDPDWLIEQRRQEVEIIQGWIDQYHQDMAETSS